MTYQRRRFISSQYYHIFQRGNHKDVIFRDTADRVWFMSKLVPTVKWEETKNIV
jgi:hypothetical protein